MAEDDKEMTYEERSKARSESVATNRGEEMTYEERSAQRSEGAGAESKIGFSNQQGDAASVTSGLTAAADAETAKVVSGIAPAYAPKKTYGSSDRARKRLKIESRPTGGSGGNTHAFQLVQVAIDDLCVRQGTIGSVIPTISATELAADYTENSLSLPGTGTREYWLKVTLDANGDITTVTIETTEPSADSATQAKLLLGSVETDSGDIVAFNSNLSGSQALASCGSTHYFGVV